MLAAIGDLVEDVVVLLSGPPNAGSDVDALISRHRGGSAANVAAAAAAVAGQARFIGRVGADELGDRLLAQLTDDGVDPAVRRGGRTGTIVALVDPRGERTMLSDRGAATELDTVDPSWLDGVTLLHVPVYSLVVEPLGTAARSLVDGAHQAGIPVSVDTSSAAVLSDHGVDRSRGLLQRLGASVVLANEAEAELLDLRAQPIAGAVLVIKRGGGSTLLIDGDRREEVEVPPAEVVDTTGAGDAFAAGFLTAWLDRSDAVRAVEAAHLLAREVLGHAGAELEP